MSHRCHVALISDHQVQFHSDKWGALGLAHVLISGPDGFRTWFEQQLEIWPDAVGPNTLGVIPEDFAVVNVDQQHLKISECAGFEHWAEQVLGRAPELADQLIHMTPQGRSAALMVLKDLWPGWQVSFAASPRPQLDWGHLPDLSADEVWNAFKVMPPPKVQGKAAARLAQSLKTLM
ncbi:hypothetical protein [Deinococcus humi]|uniref:Uncharacterized protein n=1 Tax=Deinococcus humi TaxID=662880 RepID=A0A7W8NET2_9DEIO|nr:hypothetical protein [Deinococcus humi]MBB5362083.1 hypothetical protein [Deinococcus humi]GGO22145.1 hypothetical protein GCM10008949_09120 [Deinococcus humi]